MGKKAGAERFDTTRYFAAGFLGYRVPVPGGQVEMEREPRRVSFGEHGLEVGATIRYQ